MTVHPFVGREILETATTGVADLLYTPRYLVQRWGWDTFEMSAYYRHWRLEAERATVTKTLSDLRPAGKKK